MANPRFKIAAYWGPRADAPEALAFRFLKLLNQLKLVDPLFANWYRFTSETEVEPLDMNPVSLTKTIAAAISYDDDGDPEAYYGYRMAHRIATPLARLIAASRWVFEPTIYSLGLISIITSFWRPITELRPRTMSSPSDYLEPRFLLSSKLGSRVGASPFPSRSMIFGRGLPPFICTSPG
jgi:hypothetical protein